MAYTKEEEEALKEYPGTSVAELAERLKRSPRSIIAKLSRAGVYIKPERVTKSGDPIISKADLVAEIEEALGIEVPSLVKAAKEDLRKIVSVI